MDIPLPYQMFNMKWTLCATYSLYPIIVFIRFPFQAKESLIECQLELVEIRRKPERCLFLRLHIPPRFVSDHT